MNGRLGTRVTEEMTLRSGVKIIFVHEKGCTVGTCVCPILESAGMDFIVYLPGVELCD